MRVFRNLNLTVQLVGRISAILLLSGWLFHCSMSVKVLCTSCIKDSWREIVYILILILLASILLPYLYQNLAYSAFYNPSSISQNKLLNDNLRRGQQAASFLKNNQFPGIFSRANSTGVRYCFAIVSVKRHQEMLYLTQTIARLLLLLRAQPKN